MYNSVVVGVVLRILQFSTVDQKKFVIEQFGCNVMCILIFTLFYYVFLSRDVSNNWR